MWAGIAGSVINNNTGYELAISIHDSVYNTDFASSTISYNPNDPEAQAPAIEQHILDVLRKFSTEHMCKFLGAGVTVSLLKEVRACLDPCALSRSRTIWIPPPRSNLRVIVNWETRHGIRKRPS